MSVLLEPFVDVRPDESESDSQWFVLNLSQLARLADAIVTTVGGDVCEVVLHDFRQPEQSITHISGKVTNRTVGGSMSQIGIAMMAEGNDAEDRIDYLTRTTGGRVLRSTTLALRNRLGHVVGALCINLDVTDPTRIGPLQADPENDEARTYTDVHFGNNVNELVRVMIDEAAAQLRLQGVPTDAEQRQALVRALSERGFFVIRSAVPILAEYMGVSRGLIYHYLKSASSVNISARASSSVRRR